MTEASSHSPSAAAPERWRRTTPRWWDYLAAVAIALVYIALLMKTDDMGYTRDESFYFHAAHTYSGWFADLEDNIDDGRLWASFEQSNIDQHWGYNPEHPILVKGLFALSWRYLAVRNHVMSDSLAIRFPAMVFGGLLLALVFLLTLEMFGSRFGAWIAAAAMGAMPHYFFHAHLACFDVPMTFMWALVVYGYWRSLTSTGWAWATGVFWGLALITKLNAFFIPLVFLAHWGIRAIGKIRLERPMHVKVPPLPLALFTMLMLGPVIFYLGWPRHWFDTFNRIGWYLNFHLQHEHYFVYFFGQNLYHPPFPVIYPFAMTAITTPVGILGLMLFGGAVLTWTDGASWLRGERDPEGRWLLLMLNIALAYAIIARPSTPIFGGIKHWFTALPYMATLAGFGAAWLADAVGQWFKQARWRTVAAALTSATISVAVFVPAYIATRDSHPYGISYYNAVIGGYTGAADHLAMRQFWGYASRGALPWLNAHAPEGARIAFQNTTSGAYEMYLVEGLLREDLRYAWDVENADYLVYHHQRASAFAEYEGWEAFGTEAPVHVVTIAGVPLISVYANLNRLEGAALGREPAPLPGEEEAHDEPEGSGELARPIPEGSADPAPDTDGSGEPPADAVHRVDDRPRIGRPHLGDLDAHERRRPVR